MSVDLRHDNPAPSARKQPSAIWIAIIGSAAGAIAASFMGAALKYIGSVHIDVDPRSFSMAASVLEALVVVFLLAIR